MKKLGIVGLSVLCLAACYAVPAVADKGWPKAAKIGEVASPIGSSIYYFKDNENGNICYIAESAYNRPTISCVPIRNGNEQL